MGVNLEGLNEGPEQDADGFSLPQQLDETSCSEQPQETQVDEIILQQWCNGAVARGGGGGLGLEKLGKANEQRSKYNRKE